MPNEENKELVFSILKKLAGRIDSSEAILVDSSCYSVTAFFDSNAKEIENQDEYKNKKIAFIIAKNRSQNVSSNWVPVYTSPEIEIFENKGRQGEIKPLRWGLEEKEKKLALKIVRQSIKDYFNNKNTNKIKKFKINYPKRFDLPCEVCITLWVDGMMRGCKIYQRENFYESLIYAAQECCQDSRFKPVKKEELDKINIEITLLSDIKVPINETNLLKSRILWDKCYQITYLNKKSWLLPLVFNNLKFNNIRDFFNYLKINLAGIGGADFADNYVIEIFSVFDFIESYDRKSSIELNGPIPKIRELDNNDIWTCVERAADWLLEIQENDGNFIPIVSLSKRQWPQIDWPRALLTALSLSEFGKKVKKTKYILSAHSASRYFKKYILDDNINNQPLILAYMGQLALSLEDKGTAIECANRLVKKELSYLDPISISQSVSLFIGISNIDDKFWQLGIKYSDLAMQIFETQIKKQGSILAYYAETVNNFIKLYKKTGIKKHLDFAKRIGNVFLNNQLNDGSYRISLGINNSNTSTTGKIIEVLILFLKYDCLNDYEKYVYNKSIRKAILWMISMQYGGGQMYFVPSDIRKKVIGGIRHHYNDSDARMDSVAHLILGMSRLDKNKDLLIGDDLSVTYPLKDPEKAFVIKNEKIASKTLFFKDSLKLDKDISNNNIELKHDLISNYSYLLNFLSRKNIILPAYLENILVYKKFRNTPGFFEAYLKTSEQDNCFARGFGKHWDRCLGQVTGEILERYFHKSPEREILLKASANELKKGSSDFYDLKLLSFFSEDQKKAYSNREWDDNSQFYWEKCTDWKTKRCKYFPAQLVYKNYRTNSNEPRIQESNTSGLGGFFTEEEAILSGAYEIIQRDGYFYHWLNKITPVRIDPKTIENEEFQNNYQEAKNLGFEIYILNLTVDTKVPIYATIVSDSSGKGPCYSLGAGCNPDVYKAINRSYEEAWSTYYWLKNNLRGNYDEIPKNYVSFITPISINRRLSIWSNMKMKNKLNFFISDKLVPFSNIKKDYPAVFISAKEELAFLADILGKLGKGYKIYVHLSNSDLLKEINYYSARVIIPGLIPMYYNEENAPVENPRIIDKKKINKLLHLFP